MYRLHYHPSNASFTPHVLLREVGAPFELLLVDREQGAHKRPDYLKLNPNGTIPVLEDGPLVLYETAAIALHLADRHPAAQLAPPLQTAARAHFYKWMVWLTNTLQPRLMHCFYPDRLVEDQTAAAQVKRRAEADVLALLQQLDDQLAAHPGPWLLGTDHSAADPFAFMLCRWTRNFSGRKARDFTHIAPWLQRMLQRPAVQAAFEAEVTVAPYF
ncbi:glutathione S-transferase [Burkholderiales bacterium JOSHI_001]|nr:glutathione S-transferase [Burkholderiales bacterium JOSHI_001]